ncbi:NAD(P)-dependent dehydrogenase, short-chain alcohol dehydrogenase family [Goodfellowiella coeruleoviolacea]|uniref:NAD(P)-dependent dehydrogenase, short-chain alcohol dehydrogenase family n=2 Tax=Goodfellowiella coeruleoviolacea TaxID=334858 RepID=A0AAE3G9X4_9PSEU|nr:NAD(P)-dependent dehydrogenase, short-chain alcohol dehydrogenase family [Goodfellowiella coeruleoviolacea]
MDMGLSGKTALVTGASRGIGLATVRALLAEGVRVVAGARTAPPELNETGAVVVTSDLSTSAGVDHLVERALAELGEIDVLVNNVGGGDSGQGQLDGFAAFTDQDWHQAFELNFFSAVRVTRAALPSLLRRRGSIVNISSIGARIPSDGPVPYTTAKAALTALGKALDAEFGPRGVRVNTVSPGVTRTAMWERPDGFGAEMAKKMGVDLPELLQRVPGMSGMTTGRLVEPEEVAALVTYLAAPVSASIAGADYRIDGGAVRVA